MAKRKYNTWKQEDMAEALEKHRSGEIGFNEACRRFNIPKPTLRRHLKGLNKGIKMGRPNDMTPEMEAILVQHLRNLESCFFGLSATEFRKLAFELAEKFQLRHRFNKEKKIAGQKWYNRFMKEHPDLDLHIAEPTSMDTASKVYYQKSINEFLEKYEELLDKYKFAAHQIYNMDQTAIPTVLESSKFIAKKGKHEVGAILSSPTTTCICAMNAAGEFIPPMLIFKGNRLKDALKIEAPPNTELGCSKNGWVTSELFIQWLQHFIKCKKLETSNHKQILLLLDGHSTHSKNLKAILLAHDYGIVLLSFPAHTTHQLQPLDISFFKTLKSCYNETASWWLRSHPGSVIEQANVARLLVKAYAESCRTDIALNSFKATGLWPLDRYANKEEYFEGSVSISDPSNKALDILTTPTIDSVATNIKSGLFTIS